MLSGLRDGPHEPLIADSIDFVVAHLELLTRVDLAARLQLNTQLQVLPALQQLPEDRVTIMDCNDFAAVPGEGVAEGGWEQGSDRWGELAL